MVLSQGRMAADRLSRMLGDWQSNEGGLPRALSDGVRQLIADGAIADGTILPSQRALAQALGVSRSTVSQAYEELVAADVAESFARSGCRVRRKGVVSPESTPGPRLGAYDISSGALPGLPLVVEAFHSLDQERLRRHVADGGFFPAGLPELRQALAASYSDAGLPTTSDNILITGGAQQAMWLVSQLLIGPVDEVVVGEPTSRRTLDVLRRTGARLLSAPIEYPAPRWDLLERLMRTRHPRLLVCEPVVHDPTGSTLAPEDLTRLSRLIAESDTLCVEDATSAELLFDDAPSRLGLAAALGDGHVLTLGTLSKLTWGGLRVGWIRADPAVIQRLTELKRSIDLTSSVLDQIMAVELLGRLSQIRSQRVEAMIRGYKTAAKVLAELRPHWSWEPPSGGTGMWIDTGEDAEAVCRPLRDQGVRALSGSEHYSPFGGFDRYLNLPLWYSEEHLRAALTVPPDGA